MAGWTDNELRRLGNADELEITAVRRDDTPRAPRPIWVHALTATRKSDIN